MLSLAENCRGRELGDHSLPGDDVHVETQCRQADESGEVVEPEADFVLQGFLETYVVRFFLPGKGMCLKHVRISGLLPVPHCRGGRSVQFPIPVYDMSEFRRRDF